MGGEGQEGGRALKIRVFPCDLEGSGCYRVVYPYGMLDAHTPAQVTMAAQVMEDGRMLLPIPEAMIGYREPTVQDELEIAMFMADDVYVFQRPLEKVYPGVIFKLKSAGKKVVVELDDFMHGLLPAASRKSMSLTRTRTSVEALSLCIRMADMVTVSTEALAEQYRRMNPNVKVIRNRLRYNDFAHLRPSYEKAGDRIHVGWMGLMDYRANDLSLLKPWLNKFLKAHPEVLFVNVGSKKALEYLCVPKGRYWHLDRQTFPGHFNPTSNIDIGLVPLTKGTFNECKSYLKGMEYGAVGAAVVASPTREYKLWVNEAWNGLTARDTKEWQEALEWMVADDNWRRCAEENHRKALDNLIQDHHPQWLEALTCLSPSAPSRKTVSAS